MQGEGLSALVSHVLMHLTGDSRHGPDAGAGKGGVF